MYVSRRASIHHGTYQIHLLLATVLLTAVVTALATNPTDYLVIFFSSGILFTLMEIRLDRLGIRKSTLHLSRRPLPPILNCALRGFTEGTGYCIPAYFFADHLVSGDGIVGAAVLGGYAVLWSAYSGLMDLRDLRALPPSQRLIVSRRFMTSPRLVMAVHFVGALSLFGFFLMSDPWQRHGLAFLFGTFFVAGSFFLINGLLGVRLIEVVDEETGGLKVASVPFTIAAFTYDSFFEMALMFAPFYLLPYALGWLTFQGVL